MNVVETLNAQKRTVLDALLVWCPFVLINATAPGVSVPDSLKQADLVLRLGRDPNVLGMPDLELDGEGFRATISIRGSRHLVTIPWEACSRCWIGEPFVGPVVIWPEIVHAELPRKPDGLRLVKN